MGFLDNLIKAAQDGVLEDQLARVADTIESASNHLDKTIANAAEKPGEMLEKAENVGEQISQKAAQVSGTVKRNIDIIQS